MIFLARRVVKWTAIVVIAYFAFTFVQVWWASTRDDRGPTEAIIVLGAAQYDGEPSPVLRARLDHAHALWAEGVAETILVTGGRQPGDRFTEATAGATYLHSLGVPDTAIVRETTGRSSWESLAASARVLTEQGITEVTLVSDPFHAKRIGAIASELGLDARVSPTPDSPISGSQYWRRLGTESIRVGIGRFVGFRRLTQVERVGELVPGLAMLLPALAPRRSTIAGSSTGRTPGSGPGG